MTVSSGDTVKIEMASHHACDDYDKMILGDPGMESVFEWSTSTKGVSKRGASGGGDGVHVLTGPVYINGAEPGDILKVEVLDLAPRPNGEGKTFGSNAAAWWGFQARAPKADGTSFDAGDFTNTPGSNDEVITIYEIFESEGQHYATIDYMFKWPTLTDPDGVVRNYYAYPGTCVPHDYAMFSSTVADMGWTKLGGITYLTDTVKPMVPLNMHVGCMGLPPASHEFVDSIPPMPTGGNLDDKRIGVGTTMYYPVEVAGALFSAGDAHAAQGDGELDGTAIETSITGTFKFTLVKASEFTKPWMAGLDMPLGETDKEWIIHAFTATDYLETYAANPGDIYGASALDPAMKNAYTQARKFIMAEYGLSQPEADTILTTASDFGITQLVDGNWGVHCVIPKTIFTSDARRKLSIAHRDAKALRKTSRHRKLDTVPLLSLSAENVHWGYFSKSEAPKMTVSSGDTVKIEMASHHACDDYDKMILGDPGMESVFEWSTSTKGVSKRGASGGGDGVHVLTGPVYINGAEPGDILKVEVLDLAPRPNGEGKTFGSNAAAWWGFQARAPKADGTSFDAGDFTNTPGSNDEVITIYEIFESEGQHYATIDYMFKWPTLTDPDGVVRNYYAYPGTCVPHDYAMFSSTVADMGWTKLGGITYLTDTVKPMVPLNMHVGCMGLPPASHEFVDSIPPMPTGGNLDDKRIGVGTTMYYPVEVAGALFSAGDAHAAQGDGELDGTAIETSITGTFKFTLVKASEFTKPWMAGLDMPLGETDKEWIIHAFTATDYLETYAANPGDIYGASALDPAMKNAYTQARKFIMAEYGLSQPEADTILTTASDFGITQLVDGNWGVHCVIPKTIFADSRRKLNLKQKKLRLPPMLRKRL